MEYISLNNVCVNFPVFDAKGRSLKSTLANVARLNQGAHGVVNVQALSDINLSLVDGDRVGIVGSNGAGKSTLLRVMAGIYKPSSGQVNAHGEVSALLDLNLGMDDDSTGYQNIRLRGMLLGMSMDQIREREQEIAEFTELGAYLNLPIRTYSSGMKVRLAFAISTAVEPDILLLDEVIGTGDASFIDKARERLKALHEKSRVVVLASHANAMLSKFCDKGLWLDGGRVMEFGPIDSVINAYKASKKS